MDSLKKETRKLLQEYINKNITHIYIGLSFPYHQPRDSLRRIDILEMFDVIHDFVDIRALVLYRNEISAAYSAFKRFIDNLHLQMKITEDNFIYIKSQMSQLPVDCYRTLCFEDFLSNPSSHYKELAKWWDLDEEKLMMNLKVLREPQKISEIPLKQKTILEEFFTKQRINQWKDFYMNNRLLMPKY